MNTETNEPQDGGPAFPSVQPDGMTVNQCNWGMSLRDYFAAKAMQALIAAPTREPHTGPFDDEAIADYRRRVAYGAYQFAEEMLKARKA